ncbi:hypothetical protein PSPTO_3961 [Pseudomonas syringae pv. tomato str. DC3000]|uniref:Uncharacterized protein n=1 Tax=Pseudomonas syringae pv. tomato (strain ATCC BAA-871 / DC3000) TaxID=223283 RepID=Q87Y48_PSESM|nr:hypothetical protein PSPTO_3961 [Pseudomonas syringae pv. tomato str. DC3000]PYD06216.1 hypothetical protein DND90_23965 [Pseudomonas syringae pv. maculicola]
MIQLNRSKLTSPVKKNSSSASFTMEKSKQTNSPFQISPKEGLFHQGGSVKGVGVFCQIRKPFSEFS